MTDRLVLFLCALVPSCMFRGRYTVQTKTIITLSIVIHTMTDLTPMFGPMAQIIEDSGMLSVAKCCRPTAYNTL